jgi:ferritin-like protein
MNTMNTNLAEQLLQRGDHLAIESGRLVIKACSDEQVPNDWLAKNESVIIREVAKRLDVNVFKYLSYSTGRYGKHKAQGVTLQFENILTDGEAYCIFNANLQRQRNSKHGKKGESLPDGHFSVSRKCLFYKFWVSSGLTVPSRLSVFNDYMGHLKPLFFRGEVGLSNKVNKKSMTPLNLTHAQIVVGFDMPIPDSIQTIAGQLSGNSQTRMPDKQTDQAHINKGLALDSSTCASKYGKSIQGDALTSSSMTANITRGSVNNIKVQEQTNEQWWADYDRAKRII